MNRNPVDTIDSLPEEAFLLPWYVNGTLDAEDRGRVEAALAQSAELREELELLRAVERSVVASTDAMPDPDPDGFARLMARIDAEPQRTAQPAASQGRGLLARVAGWFEVSWRPAMAAAALVIAVQAAAIVALVGDRERPAASSRPHPAHRARATPASWSVSPMAPCWAISAPCWSGPTP